MGSFQQIRAMLRVRPLQMAGLVVLLTTVGGIAFHLKFCILDIDLWWHLKVGDWIVEHMAVPHTGILSRTAASRPWVAYSWGYEVLLSRAYACQGLLGISLFGALLTVAIAYAIYWMMLRLSGRFWLACTGSAIVCSAFLFNGMPRPFFFSIALFAVVMALLLEANRTGQVQPLYWLPAIFLLWANLHIQYIYGLFAVGLFVAVSLALSVAGKFSLKPDFVLPAILPAKPLLAIAAACVVATLIGPNFYHPYVAVYEYSKAKFSYNVIQELQPLTFRGLSHYTELFLTAAGFYAVGWRRKLDVYKLSLLAIASVVAFRTMRDAWFICLAAAACIADFPAPDDERDPATNWTEYLGVAAAVAILLALLAPALDFNQRGFDRAISAEYPVNAINFLRQNPAPGPIYNNLNWGGFLMWYMPEYPVAIDGRNDLYGDQLDEIFYDSQSAKESYTTDPYLNEAGVVLLDSQLPLAKILSVDPRFQLVFHDEIATVYTRRSN